MRATYAHKALRRMAQELGYEGEPPAEDRGLVALYALLAMTKGEDTTAADVHDAWSLWTVAHRRRDAHPCLIPFESLHPEERAKDQPYVAAIHDTARHLERLERASGGG